MHEPTPSQKRAMWVYVIILFLVILAIWTFFIRKEFSQINKESEEQQPGLGNILNEFKDSVIEGGYLIENIKQSFKATSTEEEIEPEELSEEQMNSLMDKVKTKLNNRIIE